MTEAEALRYYAALAAYFSGKPCPICGVDEWHSRDASYHAEDCPIGAFIAESAK